MENIKWTHLTYYHSTNPIVLSQEDIASNSRNDISSWLCDKMLLEPTWLPESAESVNVFKGRFDKHCCLLRYCTGTDLWKNQ